MTTRQNESEARHILHYLSWPKDKRQRFLNRYYQWLSYRVGKVAK